ncbi:MAG: serine/threonine-protein kinase [Candidatus Micrarchaeota archaeon]
MHTLRSSHRDTYIHISLASDVPSGAPTLRNKVRGSLPAFDRLPGRKGSYKLVNELGNGGMGIVCLGESESTGNKVAVKFSLPESNSYIAREYYALEAVAHPNIVQVLDGGVVEGRYFLVMELLRGNDLHSLIFAHNALEPDVAIEITLQALDGLGAAHRAGVLHCDLKPANIFLADSDDSMTVKIIDFGLSKKLGEGPSGRGFGTPGFMAPEQAAGEYMDQRSDIFSLGAVLFNMLTGREPFSGTSYEKTVQTLSTCPPPPSSLAPMVPQVLDNIVMRAMEKDPGKRFGCVSEFRESLEQALGAIASA